MMSACKPYLAFLTTPTSLALRHLVCAQYVQQVLAVYNLLEAEMLQNTHLIYALKVSEVFADPKPPA